MQKSTISSARALVKSANIKCIQCVSARARSQLPRIFFSMKQETVQKRRQNVDHPSFCVVRALSGRTSASVSLSVYFYFFILYEIYIYTYNIYEFMLVSALSCFISTFLEFPPFYVCNPPLTFL